MEPTVVAFLAGLLGVVVGAGAVLAYVLSERQQREASPAVEPPLPPGLADVLAVLKSSAVLVDHDDRVVKASPAAYAFGMVRGKELVAEQLRDMVRLVRRDGIIREAELDLHRGPLAGENVHVSARVAPLRQQLILVLVEDRTESVRVEAVRRDFVANVSHELKTPVGALGLLAEAVASASEEPEAVRRFAGRMQHEAERLSVLVQDVIDLSRLQGQDALDEPERVVLGRIVTEAVEMTRLAAGAKNITVSTECDHGVVVLGDEALLVTALRNLVVNAVLYSPPDTRVTVAVRRVGDTAELSVRDEGIGIPEREVDRIFERFYRVDPARSRVTGGTGLGLSIVKHVAGNHGGEVVVETVEGVGSTFTMRLPLVPGAARASVPGTPPPSVPAVVGEVRS